MSFVSTVDLQTRLDICELLNRYCHFLDHNRGECWAELFTCDGVFEIDGIGRLVGRERLKTMPATVYQKGGGLWRHQITNIMIDHNGNLKEKTVSAYAAVSDWGNAGRPVGFYDFTLTLCEKRRWQIARLSGALIGYEHAKAA